MTFEQSPTTPSSIDVVREHIRGSAPVIAALEDHGDHIAAWADELAARLGRGQRLLAAGNGGSAAEAQHLTSELVGRFGPDRPAYSAISLHAESSAVTAIGNDYGYDQVFARQVHAHARSGDVLVLLTTSGTSENLLQAALAAKSVGVRTWAMTGPQPNPLASVVDDAICIDGPSPHVQEAQLVLVHALCRAMEPALAGSAGRTTADGHPTAAGRTGTPEHTIAADRTSTPERTSTAAHTAPADVRTVTGVAR